MAALDTNVLVRFLVADDAAQSAAARKLMKQAVARGEPLFVPITVALELEWVLRSNFGFGKADIVRTLSNLLSASEPEFESETALEMAVSRFGTGTADFSDCVHVALAWQAGHAPLWTFDKAAAKLEGGKLLAA